MTAQHWQSGLLRYVQVFKKYPQGPEPFAHSPPEYGELLKAGTLVRERLGKPALLDLLKPTSLPPHEDRTFHRWQANQGQPYPTKSGLPVLHL